MPLSTAVFLSCDHISILFASLHIVMRQAISRSAELSMGRPLLRPASTIEHDSSALGYTGHRTYEAPHVGLPGFLHALALAETPAERVARAMAVAPSGAPAILHCVSGLSIVQTVEV